MKPAKSFFPVSLVALIPPKYWIKPLWQLVVVLFIFFTVYFDTVASITSTWWRSETFAHGMLVIPITMYMIWTQRSVLVNLQPTANMWGAVFLLPSVVLWLLGSVVDVLVIQQLALLGMVWAIILGTLGWVIVRNILFPLGFLIFTIPLGEGLIPILMDITAAFTVKALLLSGFPVYWEGMLFIIPSGSFEVAKACSGVRYLFASVALGCLFAYVNYQSIWRRSVFIIISILLPIIANGLRAYGIVLIAHFSDMKYATGVDHLIYGWLFFGLIMFLLFFLGSFWRDEKKCCPQAIQSSKTGSKLYTNGVFILLPVIILLGPLGIASMKHSAVNYSSEALLQPHASGDWKTYDQPLSPWNPEFNGATHSIKGAYINGQKIVQLYIAYYEKESQGAELINQTNRFYQIRDWSQSQRSQQKIVLDDLSTLTVQQIILQSGKQKRALWYWYDLNGYSTPNMYKGKLFQAGTRLLGSDKGGAVIIMLSEFWDQQQPTVENMNNYLKEMYPAIKARIEKVRGVR